MEFDENGEYRDEDGILYTKRVTTPEYGLAEISVECNARVVRCAFCGSARVVAPHSAPRGDWFGWHVDCSRQGPGKSLNPATEGFEHDA